MENCKHTDQIARHINTIDQHVHGVVANPDPTILAALIGEISSALKHVVGALEHGVADDIAKRFGLEAAYECTSILSVQGNHFQCQSKDPAHTTHGNSEAGAIWE